MQIIIITNVTDVGGGYHANKGGYFHMSYSNQRHSAIKFGIWLLVSLNRYLLVQVPGNVLLPWQLEG